MTQTNNEREAFAIADKVIKEAYQDFNNKGNGWWGDERIPNYGILRGAIAKAICEEQSKISQNEQQEAVTNLWEALGKWSAYLASNGEQANLAPPSWLIDAVSSVTSPHKQIPDGWKLIGKVSEMGVVWHKQNPHAHPVGTEFYAVLPTTSLTSETNTEVGE